ncbi:MAG: hypothetical protein MRZ79_04785 [Bacteroidia bacterium]|nr:hypothetical protein [Bacteroidia bacterium]
MRNNKRLTIVKEDPEGKPLPCIIWFYRHQRKIGSKTFPTIEEAYYVGQYWLRKGRRLYPDRKYRFALGEPVYIAQVILNKSGKAIFQEVFTSLEEAKARLKLTKHSKFTHSEKIEVGYEWEWFTNLN